jgi:hypothetical protein
MFSLLLIACTTGESQTATSRPEAPRSSVHPPPAPPATTGALEIHLAGPARSAKPGLERPKGCIDDPAIDAAPAGPVADALVWIDRGSAPPRAAKITWSGCRPSDTAVALTPRSAIEVRNADPVTLEIGITPWPGTAPPASWRTLPPGSTAGMAVPSDPGLYLLVDKAHDWAKVLVAVGSVSGKSQADGIVRLKDVPVGSIDVHVAHRDLDRVISVAADAAAGLTIADIDIGPPSGAAEPSAAAPAAAAPAAAAPTAAAPTAVTDPQ